MYCVFCSSRWPIAFGGSKRILTLGNQDWRDRDGRGSLHAKRSARCTDDVSTVIVRALV